MIRAFINWLVFGLAIIYGLWALFMVFGALFVLGDNDTLLEAIGIFAIGFCPVPGALLGLRHRRLAALVFAIASALWIIGMINADLYLARKLNNQIIPGDLFRFFLRTISVPLFLSLFYVVTDMLKWPVLLPRPSSSGDDSK